MPKQIGKRVREGRIRKIHFDKKAYGSVGLTKGQDGWVMAKAYPISRLVMFAFFPIDNAELMEVNHKDGNRYNNHLHNLEWLTHDENMSHAAATGLMATGERSGTVKVTSEQVVEIRRRAAGGQSGRSIARDMGLKPRNVATIIRGDGRKRDGF